MSANQLLQIITDVLFVLIFVAVFVQAVHKPRRATVDTALLFGAIAVIVGMSAIDGLLHITPNGLYGASLTSLLMALPYLLVRLVDDFTVLPRWARIGAPAGLALIVLSFILITPPYAGALVLLYVMYFAGLTVYASLAFVRAARSSTGVTARRLQAVGFGSLMLALVLVAAGGVSLHPAWSGLWSALSNVLAVASGVGYFLGFSPPAWVRRSWQEPEVRRFLGRAAELPRLPTTAAIVRELEIGAASSIGAPSASIGLWDHERGMLRYGEVGEIEAGADQMIGGRAFSTGLPIFSADAARDDPAHAERYRRASATVILAAPIIAGDKRLGVLTVYDTRASIFAEEDLRLIALLADQAAVILESRALIDEAARVRAHEEAARLKDDFLSAAAHDLKTPLTAVVAQAQLLQRKALRNPAAPIDLAGIERILQEGLRLKRLVLDLLDVGRVEQGKLVAHRERVDLTALAGEACARHSDDLYRCVLKADGPFVGTYDPVRIMQLFDNFLENAVKYTPGGGEIRFTISREGEQAHLAVADTGIGISAADLPHLFDRFHRGQNVDDRRFAGLGLGLYICAGIVRQHGGAIWATSPGAGAGSTFHVLLPLEVAAVAANDTPTIVPLAAGAGTPR